MGATAHTFMTAAATAPPTSRASWSPRREWGRAMEEEEEEDKIRIKIQWKFPLDALEYHTMKNLIVQRNTDLTKLQDNKKFDWQEKYME